MHCLRGASQIGLQAEASLSTTSKLQQGLGRVPSLARHSTVRCHAFSSSTLKPGVRQQRAPAWPAGLASLPQQRPGLQQQRRHGVLPPNAIAGELSATGIIPLGFDFLTFLTATVLVVPACKWLKISPVLGFLAAGVALEQAG